MVLFLDLISRFTGKIWCDASMIFFRCPNVAIRFYCLETDKVKCEPKREMTPEMEEKQLMLANVMELLNDMDEE